MTRIEAVGDFLKPYEARLMRFYPVGNRVNNVANDDAECSQPVELSESQKSSVLLRFRDKPRELVLRAPLGPVG
jgi:hypothetical protein